MAYCAAFCRTPVVGYSSGQRGQTVNLLAYAYEGSNPSPTTSPESFRGCRAGSARRNPAKAETK